MRNLLFILVLYTLFSSCSLQREPIYSPEAFSLASAGSGIMEPEEVKKISVRSVAPILNHVATPKPFYIKKEDVDYKPSDEKCDIIVMANTDEIEAKVVEIGETEIKYKKCNNLDGPLYSVSRSKVVVIYYANGTEEVLTPDEPHDEYKDGPPEPLAEGLGIAGFFASIIGIFVFGLPLGLLAVIFGIISYIKIETNPERFKGRGFAIFAIVLGLANVAAVLFFLSML